MMDLIIKLLSTLSKIYKLGINNKFTNISQLIDFGDWNMCMVWHCVCLKK